MINPIKIREFTVAGILLGAISSGGSGAAIGGLIGLLIDNSLKR